MRPGPAIAVALALTSGAAWAMGPAAPPPPPASDGGAPPAGATPPPSGPSTASRPTSTPPPAPPVAGSTPSNGKTPEPEVVDAKPVDLSDTWSYSRSSGWSPRYVRTRDDVSTAPNPEGYYSGVSIEGNHVPPFPAAKMGSKPASLTWTGFERQAGGHSRVFFELSADVATKLDLKNGVLTLRMTNTRINVRNNARYLDLTYFRTPVRTVKVTRRGKDAIATVTLKRASEPTIAWVAGKSGYRLLVLDFVEASAAESEPVEAP